MRWLIISLSLCLSSVVQAQAAEPAQILLKVGEYYEIPSQGTQCICDDKSLVQVEWVGTNLRLTGLVPGRTQCGFMESGFSISQVYEVVVEE